MFGLAACDGLPFAESLRESRIITEAFFTDLRKRNFDAAEARMHPLAKKPELRPALEQMATYFPDGEPNRVSLISWRTFTTKTLRGDNRSTVELELQHDFPDRFLRTATLLLKEGETYLIDAAHVALLRASLDTVHAFTFEGKSSRHYLVLTFAVAVPIFILAVLVICIRTKVPKRKWLWLLFILVGAGTMTLNWTTGEIETKELSIELLGAGYQRASPFSPLMLSVSFPFGAVWFLWRRRQWRQAEQALTG
jgi:hypothetical protein